MHNGEWRMANTEPAGLAPPRMSGADPQSAHRHSLPVKCSTCDRPLDLPLVCTECHLLYPAEGLDHFALFGIPRQFDLDLTILRRQFLRLSREIHPDRTTASAAGPEVALRLSAQANHAFEVLSSPILRAEYLLELAGGRSAAEDKSAPPDLLQETLQLREEIDEARSAHAATALAVVRARIEERKTALEKQVAELGRQMPGDEPSRKALRASLNALKYFGRLAEAANQGAQK